MRNRAEITSQQIVILIIVIASFAVLLFFLFRLNLGETTDEEICHNSVLTRGSAVVAADALPLDCHRKYICINNGGDCKGLTNPEIIEVNTLDETYKFLAEQMATCWWMFGEGRVNYIGGDKSHNNYCSICSQIYFDKSLEDIRDEEGDFIFEYGKISKEEFFKYLEKTKIDDSNNYLQYMFGVNEVKDIKDEALKANDESTFGEIELGKHYFVVMGITSEVSLWEWVGIGSGIGGGFVVAGSIAAAVGLLSNPVGWVTGIVLIGSGAAAGAGWSSVADLQSPEISIITVNGRGVKNTFIAPTIIEVDSDKFKFLNCKKILTLA
jgi:hypothetical protein